MLAEERMNQQWEERRINVNGATLHVVQAGPATGPLLILLHGFPEYWASWSRYIQPLADAGYRVWVPDQRGYNLSSKPPVVSAYALDELARDITGLMDLAGRERARIVGHDWGGTVAWWLAQRAPERIERAVIVNAVHPLVWMRSLRRSPAQFVRGWYLRFFQVPRLPEATLRRNDWAALAGLLTRSSRPGTFSEEDLAGYRTAWGQPGAISGMLNWYRAILRQRLGGVDERIQPPVELIWGARDAAAGIELAHQSIARCERGQLDVIEDATHWVQHEQPERVLALIERALR
ncbi:MAG TPA: alpha/beta hydrolase [Ktedonobacterales bacterium]|nr:alpha/beta hydrolase [Ktedonobacterales bacterium]